MQQGQRNEMQLEMDVCQNGVYGQGSDKFGSFVIRGQLQGNQLNFVKQYNGAHQVVYQGTLVAQGDQWIVNGNWMIPGNATETFQLQKQGVPTYFNQA